MVISNVDIMVSYGSNWCKIQDSFYVGSLLFDHLFDLVQLAIGFRFACLQTTSVIMLVAEFIGGEALTSFCLGHTFPLMF